MFAIKVKIYGVLYNQSSSVAFDEISSYWSVPKSSLISRLYVDHHTVVWFPWSVFCNHEGKKFTETTLITKSDQGRPTHQIVPGCWDHA